MTTTNSDGEDPDKTIKRLRHGLRCCAERINQWRMAYREAQATIVQQAIEIKQLKRKAK